MKYLEQFTVILVAWMLGEAVSRIIKPLLFFPGHIIGMVLLFLFLLFEFVKEKDIKEVSDFFLSNIAFFFVPPAVGVMSITGMDAVTIAKVVFLVVITTIITMVVTALVTHFAIKAFKRKEGNRG